MTDKGNRQIDTYLMPVLLNERSDDHQIRHPMSQRCMSNAIMLTDFPRAAQRLEDGSPFNLILGIMSTAQRTYAAADHVVRQSYAHLVSRTDQWLLSALCKNPAL
jgi:hypothetical protein